MRSAEDARLGLPEREILTKTGMKFDTFFLFSGESGVK